MATEAEIAADCTLNGALVLAREQNVVVSYAPFDHVNRSAKLVIVGITPGRRQAVDALTVFRAALLAGNRVEEANQAAKAHASFSGSMRSNLVRMFDHVGIQRYLEIGSCGSLFADRSDLVHYTSALRYPVFVGDQNYSGQPRIENISALLKLIGNCLAEEARSIGSALWVPLGPIPLAALNMIAALGLLDSRQILAGFPHPSGANAERIAYFLNLKDKNLLSKTTRPEKIDQARTVLLSRISELR